MANFRILNMLVLFRTLLTGLTFFFLPLMLSDYGLSGIEIGILFSVTTAMVIISSFPAGVLNDKTSIRTIIMLGLLLLAVYYFGLSRAKDFWLFLPLFALGGLAGTLFDISAISMVYKHLKRGLKGRKLGVYHLASSLGFGIGILVGGSFLLNMDFSLLFVITSFLFLVLFFLSFSLPKIKSAKFSLIEYKELILRKNVLLLLVPLILFGMHWGAEHTSYALFLREGLGLNVFASGLYMGLPILLLGIFAYLSGISIDRKGDSKKIFFMGLFLSGAGHILMALPNVYLSLLSRIAHEIGDAGVVVSYNVIFSNTFPKKTIAGETSIIKILMILGSIAGSLVFGSMGYSWGYHWPFIISGLVILVSMASLFILKEKISL